MKVCIGFLGAGFQGQLGHLRNYTSIDDCEVVAVAEVRPGLADAVAKKYNIPKVYNNHRELLEDDEIDAVVCVQPFHNNYPLGKQVLEAGKSLLTEKPMVARLRDGEELVELAQKKGLVYAVGFMKRYDPGVQLARVKIAGFVQSGVLGKLRMIDASCFCGDWLQNTGSPVTVEEETQSPPVETRYPDHISGNLEGEYDHFLNIHSHNINLVRYLLPGEQMECVTGAIQERSCAVTFRSGDVLIGLQGTPIASHRWEEETHFVFEEGRVSVLTPTPMNRQEVAKVKIYRKGSRAFSEEVLHAPVEWSFLRQAKGFVAALLGREPVLAPGMDCLRDVELMEDVFRKVTVL